MDDMITTQEFAGRKDLCDERFSRDKTRIGKVEDALSALATLVTQLAELIKTNTNNQADHEARLRVIEARGGKWLDKIIAAFIGAIASAAITGAIAYLLNKGG